MPVAGSYPGVSLIDEIEAFHESGLDAYQALATATRNAARLMATLSPHYPRVGVIQSGARADLVLLDSNPAENLGKLRTPQGVMLRGRWYPADELAAIRSQMALANEQLEPKVKALEAAVFSRDLEQASSLFRQYRAEDPSAVLFAQYPFFFFGFSLLYGDNGLTEDPATADKAIQLYDMYRQTYPEVHSAHHVYGLALEARGRRAEALAAQLKALEIWPDFPPAQDAVTRLKADSIKQ